MSGVEKERIDSGAGKMQNRTNRNLLFGARATSGVDAAATADSEALENDNQQSIENLRGSAGTMKDIALQVDASVNDQNRMLDMTDKRFDNSKTLVSSTFAALNGMVGDRQSSRFCAVVGTVFVLLLIIYFLKK